MPWWEVTGANRATGAKEKTSIEAVSDEHAAKLCAKTMFVEKVRSLEDVDPEPVQTSRRPAVAIPQSAPGHAPEYKGISAGATMLAAFGALGILGGAILVLVGLAGLDKSHEAGATSPAQMISTGALAIGYGVMCIFISSVGAAIRDMARNSFRL